jgi:hypothetical protein
MGAIPTPPAGVEFSIEARTEFMLATIRSAQARIQALVCELDEIGASLRYGMISPEAAVSWLDYIGAVQFINCDPWPTKIEAAA